MWKGSRQTRVDFQAHLIYTSFDMKKKTTIKAKKIAVKKKPATKKKAAAVKNPVVAGEFVTKEMFVAEVIAKYPEAIKVFSEHGLHCVGCFASGFDTVESGAKVHGINVEHLLYDVNKHISKKAKK